VVLPTVYRDRVCRVPGITSSALGGVLPDGLESCWLCPVLK